MDSEILARDREAAIKGILQLVPKHTEKGVVCIALENSSSEL